MKLRRGETRPSRLNTAAPTPLSTAPHMPADMDARAIEVWDHVLAEMPPGLIVGVDGYILRCFCEAVSNYETAALLAVFGPPAGLAVFGGFAIVGAVVVALARGVTAIWAAS